MPTQVESVAVGRRWLRDVLGRQFGDGHPVTGDAMQALSEILANAVLYGTGSHVRVTYLLDGEWVEVAVHNEGRADGAWARKRAAVDDECGRGLELVDAFCEQWGIAALDEERVKVWFKVRFS